MACVSGTDSSDILNSLDGRHHVGASIGKRGPGAIPGLFCVCLFRNHQLVNVEPRTEPNAEK